LRGRRGSGSAFN